MGRKAQVVSMKMIRVLMILVGGVAIGLTACGGDVEPVDQAAVDREMDLALEGQGAEPELRDDPQGDTDALEAPAAPPPAPTPAPQAAPPTAPPPPPPAEAPVEAEAEDPAPEPVEAETGPAMITLTADYGTEFRIELRQELSTKNNQPGDRFTASVIEPLIDGSRVIVQSGAIVRGEVTAVQKSGGQGQSAIIKIAFYEVSFDGETYPLSASVVEAHPETEGRYSTGDKAARIGGGAVAGAILGRVLGGNSKGTIIGAAVGAAAGTAITLATEDVDAVLPAGSEMRLRLDEPLTVTIVDPIGG
jgi:hypothetical protein